MGKCVEETDGLTLAHPVVSNVCVFYLPESCPLDPNAMASTLQRKAEVVFSTTIVDGRSCMRAAIVNHRTTRENIEQSVRAVANEISLHENV